METEPYTDELAFRVVAARLLFQEAGVLRTRSTRRAECVSGDRQHWYKCRICKRSTYEGEYDCAIKYAVRSYACCDCFVKADAHSVLAMPSHVVRQVPLSALDSFDIASVDESVIEIHRALKYVWDAKHEMLDFDAMLRRALAREESRDLLMGDGAGIFGDDAGHRRYKRACEAVAGCDLVAIFRGADPFSAAGRGENDRTVR